MLKEMGRYYFWKLLDAVLVLLFLTLLDFPYNEPAS